MLLPTAFCRLSTRVSLITVLLILAGALPAASQSSAPSGEALAPVVPEETKRLTLQQLDPEGNAPHLRAEYQDESGQEVIFHLAFGEDGSELYSAFSDREPYEGRPAVIFSLKGVEGLIMQVEADTYVAYALIDDFLYAAEFNGFDEDADAEALAELLVEVGEAIDERDLTTWKLDHAYPEQEYPLMALFPQEVDAYTLETLSAEDEAVIEGAFRPEAGEQLLEVTLAYGPAGAEMYRERRAAFANDGMETQELTIQGQPIVNFQRSDWMVSMAHFDGFLLLVRYRDMGSNADMDELQQRQVEFFEAIDLERLAEWDPPEAMEQAESGATVVDGEDCFDLDCFDAHVARCEAAQIIMGGPGRGVSVVYSVEGSTDGGQCQLSFEFADNPNPEWEDAPLYFTVDPDESFEETGQEVLESCLEGNAEEHNCEGPLLELLP